MQTSRLLLTPPPLPFPSSSSPPPSSSLQILGITSAATEGEIKKAYRTLSRTHHPDRGGNAEVFQKIAKAYEALSDPEAKANWEKYGNPDGKQALEVAIGLPTVLLHPELRYLFLGVYIIILVVAVPWIMRRVWRANKGKTSFGLLQPSLDWTAQRTRGVPLEHREKFLPETLSGIMELRATPFKDAQIMELAEVERRLRADPKKPRLFASMTESRDQQGRPVPGSQRPMPPPICYNNIIVHAHLARIKLVDPVNREVLRRVMDNFLPFIRFVILLGKDMQHEIQCVLANPAYANKIPDNARIPWIAHTYTALAFSARFIHQLDDDDSSLRQVFTADETKGILARKRNRTLRGLLVEPPTELDSVLTEVIGPKSGASAARRAQVDTLLRDLPVLEASATFAVQLPAVPGEEGEKTTDKIYVGDTITLTVTLRHLNIADGDAVPPVYAPNWPKEIKEEWHVLILDEKGNPFHLTPAIKGGPLFYERCKPAKGLHVFKATLPALAAETFNYKVRVMSPVYAGLDVETPLAQ